MGKCKECGSESFNESEIFGREIVICKGCGRIYDPTTWDEEASPCS